MNDEEILITIASIYIAVMVIILSTPLIYYYIYEPIKRLKKAKGEKMRKKKKIEEQENRIKELEDRIKYFELKEQGATIHHGMTTTISYAYNGKIKEIYVYNIYRIVDETDRYIIIETYVGCFDDVKFDYAIIDKSDNSYYDTTKLCKHIKGYTKMKQLLENIKKKNQGKRRK